MTAFTVLLQYVRWAKSINVAMQRVEMVLAQREAPCPSLQPSVGFTLRAELYKLLMSNEDLRELANEELHAIDPEEVGWERQQWILDSVDDEVGFLLDVMPALEVAEALLARAGSHTASKAA
jgi:hypothetical protein